jgi:serine/threonine protein kinase
VHLTVQLRQKVPFGVLFPDAHPQAIDLLDRMLVFDPKRRCSVEEALAHPYFDSVRTQYTEPDPVSSACAPSL